ncbi:excitatory amino acid transporter-like [Haliotis cracherodii]|uniref:excitatory amino acid transporter-like n=1 Tax=Haliotis cracherodii TaxID=6455 RepID=UPI0039E8901B
MGSDKVSNEVFTGHRLCRRCPLTQCGFIVTVPNGWYNLKHVRLNMTYSCDISEDLPGRSGTPTLVMAQKTRSPGRCFRVIRSNLLVILTFVGVTVGFVIGYCVRLATPSQDALIWIGLPGEMYMRMLKMMILPLIICSVIAGTASLDPKCNGRVSLISLFYIITTNAIPALVSIAITIAIKPGNGVDLTSGSEKTITQIMETQDIFADLIRNLFPDNIVTACFKQAQTKYLVTEKVVMVNESGDIINNTVVDVVKTVGSAESTNVLGLVICCMIFGMATTALGDVGKPFFIFFHSTSEIIMKILRWLIWFTPVGVASLIAEALARAGNLSSTFRSLGMFALVVCVGLAVYQLIVQPILFFLVTRINPYRRLITFGRPWMVTFATASSAIAIPETLTILEGKDNKVDKRIARFVVPFAASINRDGSVVYISAACIFIGQLTGVDMDATKILLIWMLTLVISVAIPSVPSASIVAVLINLTALGIPSDSIGLLFALEWILDRLRSASNALSHAFCAILTHHFCKSVLPAADTNHEETDTIVVPLNEYNLKSQNVTCNDGKMLELDDV